MLESIGLTCALGSCSAYLKQQEAEIAAFKKEESLALPQDLNYWEMPSLSVEERQKLASARPITLGTSPVGAFCRGEVLT